MGAPQIRASTTMNSTERKILAAESEVEQHSAALKKELPLPDMIPIQVLYITGLGWLGTAAKLGSARFLFWLPSVVLLHSIGGRRHPPLSGDAARRRPVSGK